MTRIKLGLYEIKKSVTIPRILLVLLVLLIVFLYSLTFNGVAAGGGELYGILREYEAASGERETLFGEDASSALMMFYGANLKLTPVSDGVFSVEGDDVGLAIHDFFRTETYSLNDYQGPEMRKTISESRSLFTAGLMSHFHWTMFWATVFVAVGIALFSGFLGRKESIPRREFVGTAFHGKEQAIDRFSAILMCSFIAIISGAAFAVVREALAGSMSALGESICGRYSFELVFTTGNMSFALYFALSLVAFALFALSCAAFNFQLISLFDGSGAVYLFIPVEVLLQSFLAKLLWLNGFEMYWQLGGAVGFLFGGNGGRYVTVNFGLAIPLLAACLAVLLAGNLLTYKLKRNKGPA